jgi:membrane protein insertase Oxa1/YidC/SpoIIIJ
MMQLMPIFFTFLFLNFPSGLVLYWLVNNILTIAQQKWIHYKNPVTPIQLPRPKPVPEAAAAGDRRRKKKKSRGE